MKRPRRCEDWHVADCNGDDRNGCAWKREPTTNLEQLRKDVALHATIQEHEVVIVTTRLLVMDGRP